MTEPSGGFRSVERGYVADVPDDPERSLVTYLDDHRAGAAAGRQLASRLADTQRDAPWGDDLRALAADIDRDVRILDALRDALGADGGTWKRVFALAGGLVARWRPDRKLWRDDAFTLVRDLEAMTSGVAAKRQLWALLGQMRPDERLAPFDLPALVLRADAQTARLRSVHEAVSRSLLGVAE